MHTNFYIRAIDFLSDSVKMALVGTRCQGKETYLQIVTALVVENSFSADFNLALFDEVKNALIRFSLYL